MTQDSEQHTAHHGKAWHQVRAPGWATKTTDDTDDAVKSDIKKVENNDTGLV